MKNLAMIFVAIFVSYLMLNLNDPSPQKPVDLQFFSTYESWKNDTNENRYKYLWDSVADFEKINPDCEFGAIQPKISEDKFTINIWCLKNKPAT